MTTLPIARTCGTCTLCCKSLGFHLGDVHGVKARGTWCSHVTRRSHAGCGIQKEKPPACSDWSCYWLSGRLAPVLTDDDRPDRVGIVFDSGVESGYLTQLASARGFTVVFAHERHTGAASEARAQGTIMRVAQAGFAVVVADASGPRMVVWPDGTTAPLAGRT